MIIGPWVVAVVLGIGVGLAADELLRGRDPRSRYVLLAGVVGAIGGLLACHVVGQDGMLLDALTALLGALVLAFVARVGISAASAPAGW